MGFNTVVLLLNDLLHTLEKSPKTVTYALMHPPMNGSDEQLRWHQMVEHVAKENDEPVPHFQALEMLPTYHADDTHMYLAGGNSLTRCRIEEFIEDTDGSCYAMVKLPEYFRNSHSGRSWTWKKRRGRKKTK